MGRAVRHNVDAVAVLIERDFAIGEGEEGPIAAGADVLSGNEFGAALTDENAAGGDKFTAETFHAKPFADAIAPIADTALTFFMCHTEYRELRLKISGESRVRL